MLEVIKSNRIAILLALISSLFYLVFAYNLDRSDFLILLLLYAALFFFTFFLIEKLKADFWLLACFGIIFRLLFIPAIPNLSQDFYRFVWDGRLLLQGINPYLFTPEFLLNDPSSLLQINVPQGRELYDGMGALNASHYSNYPPINQLFFIIAAFFGGKSILSSVIALRVILILADIGILYFGRKLLQQLNLKENAIFWFFLSPFVIIELTGNLHFEGVMLFFIIWSLYLLFKGKWFWAAVLLGISVSVKLIPLLFLPLLFRYFSKENRDKSLMSSLTSIAMTKLLKFYAVVLITVVLTFAPFLSSEFISNFAATIALWFQNFEFNASIYYIIRWIGFQVVGWNIIETVGKVLPLFIIIFILILSFFRRNQIFKTLLVSMLFAICIYFLLSTTIHPWYIATPLLLSVFTKYKFPIVWSFLVILSYSAYRVEGFSENLWLVSFEYIVVLGFALYELITQSKINSQIPES